MGIIDKIFRKENKVVNGAYPFYTTLDGVAPIYTQFTGGVYEMELTRACIHAFANHCSKLEANVKGADLRGLQHVLDHRVNPFQTLAQFLYKSATIYDTANAVYIVPILDRFDQVAGFYPINPTQTEARDVNGEPWIVFQFANGQQAAIEWSRCGMAAKFLYDSDMHGENNFAILQTLQMLSLQNQGIENGIKNNGRIQFMAESANILSEDDVEEYRKKFTKRNLGESNDGFYVFQSEAFKNTRPIANTTKPVDPEQIKIVQQRIFDYFGTSEAILQNRCFGDEWDAYYEGKIEPFAVQLSQAMTRMTFTENELTRGNEIFFSANRLQYASAQTKLNISTGLRDRGILTTNQVLDIWNLPHVEGGDTRFIRKEYAEIDENGTVIVEENTEEVGNNVDAI